MKELYSTDTGLVYCSEFFETCQQIGDGMIDLMLMDLPYSTTANKWDVLVDPPQMWRELTRICKPDAAIILTAVQPFSAILISSNMKGFRYEWIAEKDQAVGHLNAKRQPMRAHESVLVFGAAKTYNPQKTPLERPAHKRSSKVIAASTNYSAVGIHEGDFGDGMREPRTVLRGLWPDRRADRVHPTQKPTELWEYLISTYSDAGMTVADFTAGSGTTAIAARKLGRNFFVADSSEFWSGEIVERLNAPDDITWAKAARPRRDAWLAATKQRADD